MRKKINFNLDKLTFLIGLIFGIFFLNIFLIDIETDNFFEELALGKDNKKLIRLENGKNIHCHDLEDLETCFNSYIKNHEDTPVILWLGNSQLHAINQPNPNDEISSLLLHRKLIEYREYLLTFSQPNANLQEHYILLAHFINKFPIKTLILPIVFDDMREDSIRYGVEIALDYSKTIKTANITSTGRNLKSILSKKNLINNQIEIEEKSPQDDWENYLNNKLNNIWWLWSQRKHLRSKLFNSMYKLRNSIFGIDASTTRKMIKGPYKKNLKAYEDILHLAKINELDILVYIPPIRNDVKIPYDINEYESFKKEIKNIADKNNVNFISFENIVNPEFWGYNNSTNLTEKLQFDFMHFKGEGHRLLANALFSEIRKMTE